MWQLVVATDLPPALSGLAQRRASPEMDKYLVSVWASQLPDALLRCTFGRPPADKYRASSISIVKARGMVPERASRR
ncbi:hypothetical protein PG985_014100 [Apiospora marii]|uniref:uncharacterized protein n=1 Tax=Apiospora marii TaxID=335849 RepID=UPI00312FFBFC